jgi:hypothetical protein
MEGKRAETNLGTRWNKKIKEKSCLKFHVESNGLEKCNVKEWRGRVQSICVKNVVCAECSLNCTGCESMLAKSHAEMLLMECVSRSMSKQNIASKMLFDSSEKTNAETCCIT